MYAEAHNLEVPDTLAVRQAGQPVYGVRQRKAPHPATDEDTRALIRGPWRKMPDPVTLTPATIETYRRRGHVLRSQAFRRMLRTLAGFLRPARGDRTA